MLCLALPFFSLLFETEGLLQMSGLYGILFILSICHIVRDKRVITWLFGE